MGIEENKALAARMTEDIWNQGNMAAVDELCAPNFAFNFAPPGMPSDRESYKKVITMHRNAFHSLHLTNEIVIAEGEKVAVRGWLRGVHQGEYMGIAPTGKQVTMTYNSIVRIEGGKIAEEWTEVDMVGLMQQSGAMPSE